MVVKLNCIGFEIQLDFFLNRQIKEYIGSCYKYEIMRLPTNQIGEVYKIVIITKQKGCIQNFTTRPKTGKIFLTIEEFLKVMFGNCILFP